MKQRYRRHRCYTREGAQRRRVRIFRDLKRVAIAALAASIENDLFAMMRWPSADEMGGRLIRIAKPRQYTLRKGGDTSEGAACG